MLTKQERAEIAKRFGECNDSGFYDIYTAVTGEKVPSRTTRDEDFTAISNVILNLCDTSNMVELPLDKDGEVIRIHDTLYDDDNEKFKAVGYIANENSLNVILNAGKKSVNIIAQTEYLTHKEPVTIASVLSDFRDILNDYSGMTEETFLELSRIADQLKSLAVRDEV